ncbi:hypothetical protein ACJ41O_005738 [Fusarium nematophilum]
MPSEWPFGENGAIIDIGGSQIDHSFEKQLPKAFAKQADFPKELGCAIGVDQWNCISSGSSQTWSEMEINRTIVQEIVTQMPSDTNIIDLGGASSLDCKSYLREFLAQGKTCTYVSLGVNRDSLREHLCVMKWSFPTFKHIGLWGTFEQADACIRGTPSPRLILSLGSFIFNAPDHIASIRCREFRRYLSSSDRLIVGQDGPSATEAINGQDSYNFEEYTAFVTRYLAGIQHYAGIEAGAKEAWKFESTTVKGIASTEIHEITKKEGLAIKTIGRAKGSGIHQYLIKAE